MSTILMPLPSEATATPRPRHEVADVFRQYGAAYRQAHPLPLTHRRVMHAIEVCRTAALGGHLEQCITCDYQRPVYNSCRNRHCPKCQALTKAQWLQQRLAELLPVGYFHNVFTLPHELNDLALANPRVVYSILFRSVARTLQEFAADPRYGLGGRLGFNAVLHTWDQKLLPHIHLHCVIAGGALSFDGLRWISARPHFLFPVRELSAVFRTRFLNLLGQARLVFPGKLADLESPAAWSRWLEPVCHKDWVVYCQKPFGGPERVLDYLSRYTHRVAISNHRIRDVTDGRVTFDYRDRRDGNRVKQLTIPANEFIRRFLLHVAPPGFGRIRHFGFLANCCKEQQLQRCRALLGRPDPPAPSTAISPGERLVHLTGVDLSKCPHCQAGTMVVVERFPRPSSFRSWSSQPPARRVDSS